MTVTIELHKCDWNRTIPLQQLMKLKLFIKIIIIIKYYGKLRGKKFKNVII